MVIYFFTRFLAHWYGKNGEKCLGQGNGKADSMINIIKIKQKGWMDMKNKIGKIVTVERPFVFNQLGGISFLEKTVQARIEKVLYDGQWPSTESRRHVNANDQSHSLTSLSHPSGREN